MNPKNLKELRKTAENEILKMRVWLSANGDAPLCIRLAVNARIEAVKDRIKWMDELGTG